MASLLAQDPGTSVQKTAESKRAAQRGLPAFLSGRPSACCDLQQRTFNRRHLPALWLQLPKGKWREKGGLRLKQGQEFTYLLRRSQVRDIYVRAEKLCVSKNPCMCVDEELRRRKTIQWFLNIFDPKSIDTVLCLKQSTAQSTGAQELLEGQVYFRRL